VTAFDTVVLGSAIHNSRWLPEADAFARANAAALRDRRTWLFSVLTVGNSSAALGRPFAWLVRRLSVPQPRHAARHLRPRHSPLRRRHQRRGHGPRGRRLRPPHRRQRGDHRDWRDIDVGASITARSRGAPRA
jgi:menaquinone-dependent protoporphyrinogen oxidase